jgi:signal peptidase I
LIPVVRKTTAKGCTPVDEMDYNVQPMKTCSRAEPADLRTSKGFFEKNIIVEICIVLAIVLVLFFGLRLLVQSYRVEGISMEDSFQNKDFLLVNKFLYHFRDPRRGEVIIFHPPEIAFSQSPYVKRIVGLPGDTVEIRDNRVYIQTKDGEILEDPWNTPWLNGTRSWTVPEDEYFVMGDNRDTGKSSDSREWGTVPKEDIIGKVSLRYFPLGSISLCPGYKTTTVG